VKLAQRHTRLLVRQPPLLRLLVLQMVLQVQQVLLNLGRADSLGKAHQVNPLLHPLHLHPPLPRLLNFYDNTKSIKEGLKKTNEQQTGLL
jgi:hypothetical protein